MRACSRYKKVPTRFASRLHIALRNRYGDRPTRSAPERTQPYGQRARQSLADLAHGRSARAECPKSDRYGRAVCRVLVDGVDVGLEQVRRGFAWHYVKYAHEQSPQARLDYAQAEEQARIARSGLWTVTTPTPPWDYRREQAARAEGR